MSVLVAVPACSSTSGDLGYAVRLNLVVDSSISDSALARIHVLELDVGGSAETWYARIPVSGQLGGRKGTLVYRPRAAAGHLDFEVRARDDLDAQIGVGRVSADLKPGTTVDATVVIAVPPVPDFAVPGDLSSPVDLSMPPDLAMPPPPADMTQLPPPPDLAKPPVDLSVTPDLTRLPDLGGAD